jgi:hypothetical protein
MRVSNNQLDQINEFPSPEKSIQFSTQKKYKSNKSSPGQVTSKLATSENY